MRDPRSGWIQLSAAEFVLLWSAMRLGPIPLALGIPSIGRTSRSRAELANEASLTLSGRDLGTVEAPARDLALVLRQLAAAQTLVDMTVDGQESSLAAIGSITPRGNAVAARVSDEVRIGPVERVSVALLDAVIPLPAGPGSSVNIRAADYEDACSEGVTTAYPVSSGSWPAQVSVRPTRPWWPARSPTGSVVDGSVSPAGVIGPVCPGWTLRTAATCCAA